MKLLTIDTSTVTCSVALTDDRGILAEYLLDNDKTLSRRLVGNLAIIMRDCGMTMADLDGIGVAIGPGSFTGLRVGVATAKGLALASNKPVAGFSSLAMLALNLPWTDIPVCPMLDARKQEVYAALYRCKGLPETIIEDCVLAPDLFLEKITGPAFFLGSGAVKYRALIEEKLGDKAIFTPPPFNQPRASLGALLVADAFAHERITPLALLNPSYIRPSEAEIAKTAAKK